MLRFLFGIEFIIFLGECCIFMTQGGKPLCQKLHFAFYIFELSGHFAIW